MATRVEVWVDVKEYTNIYQVSNLGRVRSLDRFVKTTDGRTRFISGKLLTPDTNRGGYLYVVLCVGNAKKMKTVHRLVAEAFIPNLRGKRCINHKNCSKLDNRQDNLEWVTHKENSTHAKNNGLVAKGRRLPQSKLSDAEVRKVIVMLQRGMAQHRIAKKMGVHQSQISRINTRTTYSHVT